VPRQPNLRAFRPFRRALLSARGGLSIPFLDPIPPNEGGARKTERRDLIIHDPAHRGANGAAMPTDEGVQDGHFFSNHPERGGFSAA